MFKIKREMNLCIVKPVFKYYNAELTRELKKLDRKTYINESYRYKDNTFCRHKDVYKTNNYQVYYWYYSCDSKITKNKRTYLITTCCCSDTHLSSKINYKKMLLLF